MKKQKAEAPDRKAEGEHAGSSSVSMPFTVSAGVLRQADRQADMKQIRNNLQAAAQVEERQAEALDRKAEGEHGGRKSKVCCTCVFGPGKTAYQGATCMRLKRQVCRAGLQAKVN